VTRCYFHPSHGFTGNTLFAYFEDWGDDIARDMAAIDANPETQRWWRLTDLSRTVARTGNGR
jgi:L-rhamnose mutarotase